MTEDKYCEPMELPDGKPDRVSRRLIKKLTPNTRKLLERGFNFYDGTFVSEGVTYTFEPMGDIYIAETPELNKAMEHIKEAHMLVMGFMNSDREKHIQASLVASKMNMLLKTLKGL